MGFLSGVSDAGRELAARIVEPLCIAEYDTDDGIA